jgi:hypothetical protein
MRALLRRLLLPPPMLPLTLLPPPLLLMPLLSMLMLLPLLPLPPPLDSCFRPLRGGDAPAHVRRRSTRARARRPDAAAQGARGHSPQRGLPAFHSHWNATMAAHARVLRDASVATSVVGGRKDVCMPTC